MTQLLTPPPPPPQRNNEATFSDLLDNFVTWLINFVTELVALVSSLNTLAAGGAYSVPYLIDLSSTADADPGNGKLRFNGATQNAATTIYLDLLGSDGVNYTAILDQLDASTSAVKGQLRIVKMSDPKSFLTFDVTSRVTATGYRKLTLSNTGGSAANPFVANDAVVMQFSRTGDKGDPGTLNTLYVRDEKAIGTNGEALTGGAGVWGTRTLNTVKVNAITGAALTSNAVTLPAGTYEFEGTVPAYAVGAHQARLYNVTAASVIDYGTTEQAPSASSSMSRSILRGQFSLATTSSIRIEHAVGSSTGNGGGLASNRSPAAEVYTEIRFRKIA